MSDKGSITILSEADVATLLAPEDALIEMRLVFMSMAQEMTNNFSVVRERLGAMGTIFGIKSAVHWPRRALGLKAGGHFPKAIGPDGTVGGHQSSIMLFDIEFGALKAVVSGNLITRLRTAAAAALSIDLLSRGELRVLAVIGAGAQSEAHIRAALMVRPFTRILLNSRDAKRAHALASRLEDIPGTVEVVNGPRDAIEAADVVITLTPASAPIVEAAWVQPGTHFACMGADTVGKQEVDATIVRRARVFTDSLTQAVSIGECQTAAKDQGADPLRMQGTLGDVLLGRTEGRLSNEVTLFDGTGVAAQDLAMAALALDRMEAPVLRFPK